MILLTAGVVLFFALLIARYAFFTVLPKNFVVFNLFGWRWRKAKEGLTFIVPFIEKAQPYSAELDRLEIKVKAMSKDKLEIDISGSLKFWPDYKLLEKYDETRVKQVKALEDSIKGEIGVLAGTKEAEAFISEREAIETIINCRLRLAVMPHRQNKYPEVKAAGGSIKPENRIKFYKKYLKKVQDTLRRETCDPRRSHIEETYGIDVDVFNITAIDYSEATKKALEAKKQAEFKREASEETLKLVDKYIAKGASAQEAINAAQTDLDKAEKEIHSIEGLKGLNISIGGSK